MKECKDVDDVIELVAMELETLPTGPHIWVRERKPQTVAEAGQLADDYVQARLQEDKKAICMNDRKEETFPDAHKEANQDVITLGRMDTEQGTAYAGKEQPNLNKKI